MCNVPCLFCDDFDECSIKTNEKLIYCQNVNYECINCKFFCHCNNTDKDDEYICIFDCDKILCPLN